MLFRSADWFAARQSAWEALQQRHALRAFPFERLSPWVRGDYSGASSRFSCEYDVVSDVSKLRSSGFAESLDTGAMFVRLFDRLRAARVIP